MHQVRYAYLVELRPTAEEFETGFVLPKDQILPGVRESFAFFSAAAKHLAKVLKIREID